MTWFLRDDPVIAPAPPPEFADAQVPSRGEQFMAGMRKAQIEGARWFSNEIAEGELQEELIAVLGGEDAVAPRNSDEMMDRQLDPAGYLLNRIATETGGGRLPFGNFPVTREQFDAEVTARLNRERAEATDIMARGNNPWVQFSGELVGSMDWYDVGALPIGGPALKAGGKLTTYVGQQMLLGAGLSVPGVVATQAQGERLGFDPGNPVAQVAAGAALQGGLAGIIGGVLRIPEYVATRLAGEKAAREAGVDPIAHEAATDAAEEALDAGKPVPVATGGQFAAVEAQYGLPAGYLDRTYIIESGGNPNAQNPNSSAGGGFQFIDSTARAYGLTNKFDLDAAADAAARLAVDNQAILRRTLGRDPTAAELYLAHQQGGGGAAKLLANPDARAVDIVGAEAVRLNGGNTNMTAGQFAGLWINKFNSRSGSTYVPSGGATGGGRRTPRSTMADEVSTPAGTRVKVEYQVVDMASLRAASGDLQPRDRSRAASDEQIAKIAARLDPALLMPGPLSDRGTPLVGPDGIIESGNGRVQGLARAAEINPEAYAAYVQAIRDEGFDVPEGMTRPVLIARRTTDLDQAGRIQVIRESNTSAIGRMSGTEQARFDADGMTQPVFDAYRPGKTVGSLENAGFVQRFMGSMTPEERAPLMQANGRLSADGLKRIQSALFARAFDAKDLLTLVAETESRAITRLVNMLESLAPDWAYFRSLIDAGYVRPEFDITAPLTEAVRIIANARAAARDGQSVIAAVRDRLAQTDMFTPRDPMIEAIIDVFYKGDRARGIEASEEILKRYASKAAAMGRADAADLADDAASPVDVLRRAITDEEGGSPYAPLPARALPEAAPDVADIAAAVETFDPARFTDGTASPAVQAADDALLDELVAARPQPADPAALVASMTADGPRQLVVLDQLPVAGRTELKLKLLKTQPHDNLDDLMAAAAPNHQALNDAAAQVASELGLPFKSAPLKERDRVIEKVTDKYAGNFRKIADVARAGVTADSIEAADAFVARMAARFHLIDEGWIVTAEGYIDRKIMVRFDDGMVGELQIWPPGMREAKGDGGGHDLYAISRDLSQDQAARDQAVAQMRALYGRVAAELDPSFQSRLGIDAPWRASASTASSAESSIARSSPSTSSAMGRDQVSGTQTPSSDRNRAVPLSDTAWSSANPVSNNLMGDIPPSFGDTNTISAPAGEVNAALAEARAVLAPDDILTFGEGDDLVRVSVADAIRAIEQDRALEEVMEACKIGRARA